MPADLPASSASCPYSPPRYHFAQPYELSLADTTIAISQAAGITLQGWQRDILRDWAACDEDGQFVHRRNLAGIPRQAGKSTVAIAWVTSLVLNGYHVLWTCHNYSTTSEMRKRFVDIFGSKRDDPRAKHPEFNAYVSGANNKTGQEAIEFTTGGVLAFSTRTASATLGYSFDVVIYDEAQELTDEQQQVILPTTTSGPKKNPQSIYTGTPLRPGRPGTVFARERLAILEGAQLNQDYSLWEWGVAEVGDIYDEGRWAEVNPSIGSVANVDAIRMALPPAMTELAFAQEYLGYWLPTGGNEAPDIDADEWGELATDDPPKEGGKVVYAFKFAPDGSTVALAACRRVKGLPPHVELVRYQTIGAGTEWCAEFAEARRDAAAGFVVDGGGFGADLRDEMTRRGMPKNAVIDPGTQGMSAACAKLLAGITGRAFTHYAQPAMDACALSAKKRQIGRSGFGFEGIGGTDAIPLEAFALALWGIDKVKRDPTRRAVVR